MHVRGLHPKFCAIRAFSTPSKCPYRGANFPMHALHPTLCAIREFSTSSKCPYRGETIPMHVRGLPPTLHAICAFSKSPQTQTPIEATRVACTYPGCTKSFDQNGTCKPVERARSFAGLNEKPAHSLTPWARACPRFRRCGFSVNRVDTLASKLASTGDSAIPGRVAANPTSCAIPACDQCGSDLLCSPPRQQTPA